MSLALEHRNSVIAKIMAQYDADSDTAVLPVVSIEDFFEHNWDESSLAPNIAGSGRPPLAECYRILREIRERPTVQDVLIAIHESPYADEPEDEDIWPDSDTIYVLTSATDDEVAEWASPLMPTEIGSKWSCNTDKKPSAAPELMPGMRVVVLWWD
ncbi:hypothetical protein [Stieleria varia]|uniref:Uncharacterized protein n=1 Tax=Stieleria varia TaxID=2528005 RepID=A0A5C6AG55_9BACT|nr:hypothetical protein [Stieleria varia]TWT98288.1 hypothetical protein Pla52n_47990 [Stieleria varia]